MATHDSTKPTIYGALFCPYVQRSRISMAELGADYNFIQIDVQNKPKWYLELNPAGTIPTLVDEKDHAIYDSVNIVQYLLERYSDKKNLISSDVTKRADSRFFITFYGEQIGTDYNKFLRSLGQDQQEAIREYKTTLNAHLFRLNRLLVDQSSTGPYFLGEEFSFADIGIASFVIRMLTFNKHCLNGYVFEAVEACPRLKSYFEALISRPSVQETFFGEQEYLHWLSDTKHIALPK